MYYPVVLTASFLLGLLSFLHPILLVASIPLLLLWRYTSFPPILFFLLGFLRMFSILGTGKEVEEGEGWFVVSVYAWGKGRVLYEGRDKVKSDELVVLLGDRPAFPTDEVLVRGVLRNDTLRVKESYTKRGVKSFYNTLSSILLERTLSEDQYNFALSVISGVKGLRWEVKRAFYETGTGHILAISGLHVGLIFLALTFLLRFFLPGVYVAPVATAVVWAYAYAVGFPPSVVRATTLLTFFSLSTLLSRPVKPFNVLALSLLFSLLFKPLWIFSPSLWLSYSAVAGLFTLRGKLGALVGAHLFSLPFALHYFGRFALLYIPLNLVVIPLMTAFMYTQILAFAFPYPFTQSAALFYDLMEWTVLKAYSLNLPAIRVHFTWFQVAVYILTLSILIFVKDFRSRGNQR